MYIMVFYLREFEPDPNSDVIHLQEKIRPDHFYWVDFRSPTKDRIQITSDNYPLYI